MSQPVRIQWHAVPNGRGLEYGSDPLQPVLEVLTHALIMRHLGAWCAAVIERGRTSFALGMSQVDARAWAEERLKKAYTEETSG